MFLPLHDLVERTLKLYQGPAFYSVLFNIKVETFVHMASWWLNV